MTAISPADVIAFWLEAGPERWFVKDTEFDAEIRDRFSLLLEAARTVALDHWAATMEGRLALVIVLDQFARNIHRGSPLAFAGDGKALAIARAALAAGDFEAQPPLRARWLLFPFEHHEAMAEQDIAVALAERIGEPELVDYAILHRDIIARFGRFPHRNAILGRESTEAERAFLAEGGFAG